MCTLNDKLPSDPSHRPAGLFSSLEEVKQFGYLLEVQTPGLSIQKSSIYPQNRYSTDSGSTSLPTLLW